MMYDFELTTKSTKGAPAAVEAVGEVIMAAAAVAVEVAVEVAVGHAHHLPRPTPTTT